MSDNAIYIRFTHSPEGDDVYSAVEDADGNPLDVGEYIENDPVPGFSSLRLTAEDIERALVLPITVRRAVRAGSIRSSTDLGVQWEVKAVPGLLGWAEVTEETHTALTAALRMGVIEIDAEGKACFTEPETASA